MKNKIIDILVKSENIELEEKNNDNYKYYFIKGDYKKVYLICEDLEDGSEEILKKIEKICIEDEILKDIWPQFIYTIILKRVNSLNEQVLKDIIAVEENEYFCKKYVLYYENKEVDALNEWMNRTGEHRLENMLNLKDCIQYIDKSDDKKENWAVKLLLRLIIKCPFVRYELKKDFENDFEKELDSKLSKIRNIDRKTMWDYKNTIFDNLNQNNIDEMVDVFIQKVRKETKENVN